MVQNNYFYEKFDLCEIQEYIFKTLGIIEASFYALNSL